MEEQPFNIPIDEPQKEFAKHLEPKENKRIIFSAPFGTGKTYFLKKFFDGRKTKEKVIHLFPVNYSVSSNEDVFELIKFDILLQLLEDESIELDDNSFSTFFIAQFFLLQNAGKVVEWILNRFGKVGKAVNKHAKMVDRVVRAYQKFEHEMQTNADKSTAVDFLLAIKNQQGNVHESDAITNLICGLIQQYEENNQKTVLIIDDLDRIDPEHIFRLLNVFAAHFDIGAPDTNKFGFDKVIFVCDINNIRNIFYAKYGSDTDFSGYIDKFYSDEIFIFDNIKEVSSIIEDVVLDNFFHKSINSIRHIMYLRNTDFFGVLTHVLCDLYKARAINLRMLKNLHSYPANIKEYELLFSFFGSNVRNSDSFIAVLLDILKKIFGSSKETLKAINKASTFNDKVGVDRVSISSSRYNSFICQHILPILAFENITLNASGDFEHSVLYECDELNVTFRLEFVESNRSSLIQLKINEVIQHNYTKWSNSSIKSSPDSLNYFKLLSLAFKKLQAKGVYQD